MHACVHVGGEGKNEKEIIEGNGVRRLYRNRDRIDCGI